MPPGFADSLRFKREGLLSPDIASSFELSFNTFWEVDFSTPVGGFDSTILLFSLYNIFYL